MRAALVIATVVLASTLTHGQQEAPLAPDFDWVLRHSGSGFSATFDACVDLPTPPFGSRPTTTTMHAWIVDYAPGSIFPKVIFPPTTKCKTSIPFSKEGNSTVTLSLGGLTRTKPVMVQDWVIVALGDSYGSGEGNPEGPLQTDEWVEAYNRLHDALDDLAGSNATAIVALTRNATAAIDDLVYCLGSDRVRHSWFGVVWYSYSPRTCLAELLNPFSLKSTTRQKIDNINTWVVRINVAAGHEIFSEIGISLDLLNPVGALRHAIETYEAAKQVFVTAADTAQAAFDAIDADFEVTWGDTRCHRSDLSGQARAAQRIENADPHTTVTFIYLSCSGAKISSGALEPYAGRIPPKHVDPLDPQVDAAKLIVGDREVDAVIMSLGGNDAKFGDIARGCIVQQDCSAPDTTTYELVELQPLCLLAPIPGVLEACLTYINNLPGENSPTGAELFNLALPTLPDLYDQLNDRLILNFPNLAQDPRRILITEYPDTTQDEDGNDCHPIPSRPFDNFPGMSGQEWHWVRESMTPRLNEAVYAAAVDADHRWTYVGGIVDDFARHGYCSTDSWLIRLQESFLDQGDQWGTLHPTANGHRAIADRLLTALKAQLYTNSDLTLPRPPLFVPPNPEEPPVTIAVPPEIEVTATTSAGAEYLASTWSRESVTVHYACEDLSGSGLAECTADQLFNASGITALTTGTATDNNGNISTTSFGPIKIDLTNPGIAVNATNADSTPYDSGTWANEPVSVHYTCTDAESGIASCTGNQLFGSEGATFTANGGATDNAGNSTNASFGPIKIDLTAPVLGAAFTTVDGAAYVVGTWTNRHVSVNFTCADDLSGVAADSCGEGDQWPDVARRQYLTVTADGSSDLTAVANDVAGNETHTTFGPIMIDTVPPTLAFGVPQPAPSAAGWHNATVTIPFTAGDASAGVQSASPATPLQISGEGVGLTGSVQVTDRAGNTASFTSPAVKIDRTAPEVTITSPPTGLVLLQDEVAAASFVCSDALSGLLGCMGTVANTASIPSTTTGSRTFTVTGTDAAGNVTVVERHYSVVTLADGLTALALEVENMNLRQGIANALDAKLDAIAQAIQAANSGQRQDALNKLNAFMNAVQAQRGKALSDAQADQLIAQAMRFIAVLS